MAKPGIWSPSEDPRWKNQLTLFRSSFRRISTTWDQQTVPAGSTVGWDGRRWIWKLRPNAAWRWRCDRIEANRGTQPGENAGRRGWLPQFPRPRHILRFRMVHEFPFNHIKSNPSWIPQNDPKKCFQVFHWLGIVGKKQSVPLLSWSLSCYVSHVRIHVHGTYASASQQQTKTMSPPPEWQHL